MLGEQTFHTDVEISYLFKAGNGSNLVVVFSGFNDPEAERQLSYNYVRTLSGVNCNKLYILDHPKPRGSYYLGKHGKEDIENSIFNLITHYKQKLKLKDSDIISCGSSKGGTSAIYYGFKYNFGLIIAGGPQIFIADYLKKFNHTETTLSYMIGDEKNKNALNKLNEKLISLITEKLTTKLVLFTSQKDWQYEEHIIPFLPILEKNNINFELIMSEYPSHGEIGGYFSDFLHKQILSHIYGVGEYKLKTKITTKIEFLECEIDCKIPNAQFAFYLKVAGEQVANKWYSSKNKTSFDLIYDRTKVHEIVFFVKDKFGNIYTSTSKLKPIQIDFNPLFMLKNNKLNCLIQTSQENLEFAFYLYLNNENVRQKWYSENNKVEFEIEKTPIKKFEVKYFIKDSESNIVSRSIKYDKLEPEENAIKSKNQYDFFISTDKRTIYKSINSSNSELLEILEKPGKMERFSKILSGKQFSSQINNHIVKGFDEEPNGSYKSNYIEGYRLDLLTMIINKFPSLNLLSKLELEKITQQCEILLDALQDAKSKGELCGDWALHNLIYSTSDDKIYNIDLEGFMTYDPLPEWASLDKIKDWFNNIINLIKP